ncbi:MAG: hypothetical protein ACUVV0_07650, partial [Anaerolineae bacterium]
NFLKFKIVWLRGGSLCEAAHPPLSPRMRGDESGVRPERAFHLVAWAFTPRRAETCPKVEMKRTQGEQPV